MKYSGQGIQFHGLERPECICIVQRWYSSNATMLSLGVNNHSGHCIIQLTICWAINHRLGQCKFQVTMCLAISHL